MTLGSMRANGGRLEIDGLGRAAIIADGKCYRHRGLCPNQVDHPRRYPENVLVGGREPDHGL
jgi:hypothetical protein